MTILEASFVCRTYTYTHKKEIKITMMIKRKKVAL